MCIDLSLKSDMGQHDKTRESSIKANGARKRIQTLEIDVPCSPMEKEMVPSTPKDSVRIEIYKDSAEE